MDTIKVSWLEIIDAVRELNNKIEALERELEVSPQDPAICEYSGLRPVEGYKEEETYRIDEEKIDDLMDTLHKIDETPEERAYRRGYMDGYDEGLYDGEYK